MAITVQGIRIATLTVTRKEEGFDIQGQYDLMSNTGNVLAKQGFNGYNDMKINQSPTTQKAFRDFLAAFSADVQLTLGLEP